MEIRADPSAPGLVCGRQARYGEYQAPIYNLCARVLGDREEAKDVTQEVFIKALGQLPAADTARRSGSAPGSTAWRPTPASTTCARASDSTAAATRSSSAAARVDEFERAQTVALVERSLAEMNQRYRTALVLKDLQGFPAGEIAEVMEVSTPTADVLVHRARASIRAAFARTRRRTPVPAALGVVLVPLSVPAALQALPPLSAQLLHAPPLPDPLVGRRPRRSRPAHQDRRRRYDQGGDHGRRRDRRHRRRRRGGQGGRERPLARRIRCSRDRPGRSAAAAFTGARRSRAREPLGRSSHVDALARRGGGSPRGRRQSSRGRAGGRREPASLGRRRAPTSATMRRPVQLRRR